VFQFSTINSFGSYHFFPLAWLASINAFTDKPRDFVLTFLDHMKTRYRRAMLENQIKNAIALSDPNALRSVLVKAENSELSEGWLP